MSDELWDAYDNKLNRIDGVTLIRGDSIDEGVYHLVCEIAVKHVDGTYLLMQRDFRKHYGGMWELTAGGSALKGENPIECAARELLEETGILAKDLQEIGRVVQEENHSYYVEYLCLTDCDKNCVTLQERETVDYKWVSKAELLENLDKLASTRIVKWMEELC